MASRRSLDAELVRRKLADTPDQAVAMVASGRVLVAGAVADNATRQVHPSEAVSVVEPQRYVGRGGFKLEAGLERFDIDVACKRAVDVGSSTGGFTDCLLQRGASFVTAIDVGTNQLHERLRNDVRVSVREQTNVKNLDLAALGIDPFDVLVADLSFISLRTVAAKLTGLVNADADLVLLVKPQFESSYREASKGGGVIRDPAVWKQAIEGVISAMSDAGAATMGVMVSPITGATGNVEFLMHSRAAVSSEVPVEIDDVVAVAREKIGK